MSVTTVLRCPRRGESDRGITVVFFAIGLTAMLTVGALVLGGSVGYTAARNAQTAADAAALAGTAALQEHKQDWVRTPATAVLEQVRAVVDDNGGDLVRCDLVGANYAISSAEVDVIGPCAELGSLDEEPFRNVAGVRVQVSDTRPVAFSAFVDRDTITGGATAAATIQSVTSGRAPFMVCASPDAKGHPAQALLPDATDATGYSVNPAAVGKLYVLWGNHVKYEGRSCGNPSSDWRGLVKFNLTFNLPSTSLTSDADWWQTESGNTSGNLPDSLAGGNSCRLKGQSISSLKDQIGCEIAIPLCPSSNKSSSDFRLYCVKIGAFKISHVGGTVNDSTAVSPDPTPCGTETSNIICGEFLGAATAVGGRGIAQRPDPNGIAVIKLVQ